MYLCNETLADMFKFADKIGRDIRPTSLYALSYLYQNDPTKRYSIDKVADFDGFFVTVSMEYDPNATPHFRFYETGYGGRKTVTTCEDLNGLFTLWKERGYGDPNYQWQNLFSHSLTNTIMAQLETGIVCKQGNDYVARVDNPKGNGTTVPFCNLTLNSIIDLFEMYA